MPSVTKLAITTVRNIKGKLFARSKGIGKSQILVPLYDIATLIKTGVQKK